MIAPRTMAGLVGLGLGFGVAALVGCFDGAFLVYEQCSKDRDCGAGQECVDGLCLECSGDVCNPYTCPVSEIDGVCPCPGRAKYDCQELSSPRSNKLDILLVVDNAGLSQQARLGPLMGELITSLDENEVDYRIAMTTTEIDNPGCSDGVTTPASGAFVLDSCLARLDEFVADGVDIRAGCEEACAHETIEIAPTTIEDSDEELVRPWIEAGAGANNIGGGVSLHEALACTLPQGIAGCEYEAPLESLYQALDKAATPGNPNSGFVRDDAHLLVVLFTDGDDCSHNPAAAEIFTSNPLFWAGDEPSQALCWNAGVECLGDPPEFYDCLAVDRDPSDGSLTLDGDQAALFPVTRYIEQLAEIEDKKHDRNPNLSVVVTLVAGVEEGYEGEGVSYALGLDEDFELEHGIGPGCVNDSDPDSAALSGVPPVRLLKFADAVRHFDANNLYSVCSTGDADSGAFDGAFEEIEAVLDATIPALCMPSCVEEPVNCELGFYDEDAGEAVDIPACELVGGEYIAGDAPLCFYTREADELAPGCLAQGSNVQFVVVNGNDVDVPERLYAACEPATSATSCPSSSP